MNDFTFTSQGFQDYLYWQTQDKKTLKKINTLLEDIRRNGALQGIGKPGEAEKSSGIFKTYRRCKQVSL